MPRRGKPQKWQRKANTWSGGPHLKVDREVGTVEQALAGAQQRRRQRDLARGRARARRVRALPAVGPEQHHARACAARARSSFPVRTRARQQSKMICERTLDHGHYMKRAQTLSDSV